jgi:hypothetical protein
MATHKRALYERMDKTPAPARRNMSLYAFAETIAFLIVALALCALALGINALIPKGW